MKLLCLTIFVVWLSTAEFAFLRESVPVQFWLYTESGTGLNVTTNPIPPQSNCSQFIFFVHGFNDNINSSNVMILRDSCIRGVLRTSNERSCLVLVDWSRNATGSVFSRGRFINATQIVSQKVSDFIRFNTIEVENCSCIGHGLGAHICGLVGKSFNGQIDTIWALDAAGDGFAFQSQEFRLAPNDAKNTLGIYTSIDLGSRLIFTNQVLFPEDPNDYPDCKKSGKKAIDFCESMYAVRLFARTCNLRYRLRADKCLETDFTRRTCVRFSKNPNDVIRVGYWGNKTVGTYFFEEK